MLLRENSHPSLTKEELAFAEIKQIKSGMNKGRIGEQAIDQQGVLLLVLAKQIASGFFASPP